MDKTAQRLGKNGIFRRPARRPSHRKVEQGIYNTGAAQLLVGTGAGAGTGTGTGETFGPNYDLDF